MTSTLLKVKEASRLAPIVVRKSDANLTLGLGGAYQDIDPSGTVSARTLDVVIPGVKVGDWVQFTPNGLVTSSTIVCYFDCFTIVAGAPVHKFGDPSSLTGVAPSGWAAEANLTGKLQGAVSYQIQAGDIENGAVRLRMKSLQAAGAARLIFSGGGGLLTLEGRGPF